MAKRCLRTGPANCGLRAALWRIFDRWQQALGSFRETVASLPVLSAQWPPLGQLGQRVHVRFDGVTVGLGELLERARMRHHLAPLDASNLPLAQTGDRVLVQTMLLPQPPDGSALLGRVRPMLRLGFPPKLRVGVLANRVEVEIDITVVPVQTAPASGVLDPHSASTPRLTSGSRTSAQTWVTTGEE